MSQRVPPVVVQASSPPEDPKNAAVFIFLHGLGDDGSAFEDLAQQVQNANKLPHLTWIFPSALENRDAMQNAWFYPTPPTPLSSQRPELDDPEDEDGMLQTIEYISTLIEEQVQKGVPLNRIVVGGFSQGCALALLLGLTTKHSGKLAGVCGLAGFLPLADRILDLRIENNLSQVVADVPVFFMRGTKDMLVLKRFYSGCLSKLKELGVKDELVEAHEYDGLGHTLSGAVIRDMCGWLARILPQ